MAQVRLTTKGQITVPRDARERLGLRPGDMLELAVQGDALEIRARRRPLAEFRGVFATPGTLGFQEERRQTWDARAERLALANERL